jgi:hypothetical protein
MIIHVSGRIVILIYDEDARVLGILIVQFFKIFWIQGDNSSTSSFGMSKVDCIILTSKRRVDIRRGLDSVTSFEEQSL